MTGFITPKLELKICAAIREQVEASIRWRRRDGEKVEPYFQGGGEMRVWLAVQQVIEEDGCRIIPRAGETI